MQPIFIELPSEQGLITLNLSHLISYHSHPDSNKQSQILVAGNLDMGQFVPTNINLTYQELDGLVKKSINL